MKKLAKDLQKGDKILIAGQECTVEDIEISEIGKHGKRKVRIEAVTQKQERIVIIRLEDFPFETV